MSGKKLRGLAPPWLNKLAVSMCGEICYEITNYYDKIIIIKADIKCTGRIAEAENVPLSEKTRAFSKSRSLFQNRCGGRIVWWYLELARKREKKGNWERERERENEVGRERIYEESEQFAITAKLNVSMTQLTFETDKHWLRDGLPCILLNVCQDPWPPLGVLQYLQVLHTARSVATVFILCHVFLSRLKSKSSTIKNHRSWVCIAREEVMQKMALGWELLPS